MDLLVVVKKKFQSNMKMKKFKSKPNQKRKSQNYLRNKAVHYIVLTSIVINKSMKSVEDLNCTICLDYIIGCKVAICGHSFCE